MRNFLLFFAASLAFANHGFAVTPTPSSPPNISPNLAANHIGQTVAVCGVVSQVVVTRENKVFLNFGGVYPHHLFSAVVGKRRSPALLVDGPQWLKDLEGKEVTVTGEVKIYGGKPEIVIRTRDNLKIPDPAK